ncbi:hypothetical protein MVES1_001568 [Malassezia vespertilionis]|nr:uncharacterized protein MVES1_001568 [Malassezia vespertilionis]WFD06225.1 hypothetical protein MVES1_001568 [Malassezia vespertilionis]
MVERLAPLLSRNAACVYRVSDWILLAVMVVYFRHIGLATYGFRQQFSVDDINIQHPHAKQQHVTERQLFIYSCFLPALCIAALSFLQKRPLSQLNVGLLGLFLAVSITASMSNTIKLWVGRPRPDFLARCKPHVLKPPSHGVYHSTLVTDAVCTADIWSHTIVDGFKSFPSGHSSCAFSGLVYLALYIRCTMQGVMRSIAQAQYNTFELAAESDTERGSDVAEETNVSGTDSTKPRTSLICALALPLLPIMAACYIAMSRLMDYKHHPTDVLAGGILGTVIAVAVFSVYRPLGVPAS